MDPVTHALTSIALGRAGLNKVTRVAIPMLVVSGMAADIDWFSRLGGARAFLLGYHTVTHSILGTAVLSLAVALPFFLVGRKYPKFGVAFFPALLICAVGAGVHLLFDLLNSYGVKLLWPFGSNWYAFDLVAEVDGWIIFFLLAGLLMPELFRLVLEEIGARPKHRGKQRGAIMGLALVALFIAARGVAHQRVLAILGSTQYRAQAPLRIAAFPHTSTLLGWSGVVETDNALVNIEVSLLPGSIFDPELAEVHFKPEESPQLTNALNSASGMEFVGYARFPLANVEPEGHNYQVRMRDMRYWSELPGRRGVIAVIDLDARSHVTGQRLEFDAPPKLQMFY